VLAKNNMLAAMTEPPFPALVILDY
jgi:hypothetical protein